MTWNNKNKGVTNRWWIKHQIYFHSLRGWRSERMKGAVSPNKIKFRMPSGLCWEEGHISCLLMQESLFSPAFMMYSNPQALIEQTIIKTHLIFCTSTLRVDLNTSLWWFVISRIIDQKLFTARTWFGRKQKSQSLVNSPKKKHLKAVFFYQLCLLWLFCYKYHDIRPKIAVCSKDNQWLLPKIILP